jgi:formyltetrahydrofolate-dependent phosphoribosylglycinamide formyltransferase
MRLIVLISGSGSNLQALIDAIAARELDAQIVRVVSNRKAAFGLERAARHGIPTLYAPLKPYTDAGRPRAEYDADLAALIAPDQPGLVVHAGWMHIFTPAFLDRFPGRVINLHPALPGVMAGKDSLRGTFDAVRRGEQMPTGCMVHRVIPEVDAGEVIDTMAVPVLPVDALDDFAARMHAAEHALLVRAVRRLSSGHTAAAADGPLVLRPFLPADQLAAQALVRAGLADHFGGIDPSLNPDLTDIGAYFAPGAFLIAERDGELLGVGGYVPHAPGVVKIERMSVRRDLRGLGLGKRILNALLADAHTRGNTHAVLETTSTWSDVIAFYTRNGFRVTHTRDDQWGGETWFEKELRAEGHINRR